MLISAPIYKLKRRAKQIARDQKLPLYRALDHIAQEEGFASWSLLSARLSQDRPAARLMRQMTDGELVLLAARPGQGKTVLGLDLLHEAAQQGKRGVFFTLDWTKEDVAQHLAERGTAAQPFQIDTSDEICADYIIQALAPAPQIKMVVIDYLQLLDQKRQTPPLQKQVEALRGFARSSGRIIVAISQLDRRFDLSARSMPDISDIRLPNPVDLTLFDRFCFLHGGQINLRS